MPRRIKGPGGIIHSFPDDATDAEISGVLEAVPEGNKADAPKAKTWSERLGLNEGTDSPMVGFMRGAASGVVDLAQGATAAITGQMNEKLRSENESATQARSTFGNSTGIQAADNPTLPDVESPSTFSGKVGSALPVLGEMAIGGQPVARAAKAAIPSAARAGEKFQDVMGAARHVTLELAETGDAALRIMQLAERGASMPMAVRKLLVRMTDPKKGPMAYEEGRDFASTISRLSADEMKRLTPVVKREVANLSVALNKANALAARSVGKGEEFNAAMREYAKAMKLRSTLDAMISGAKKGLPIATAAGAGAWLVNKARSVVGGQ
jgi:hypothetical protein